MAGSRVAALVGGAVIVTGIVATSFREPMDVFGPLASVATPLPPRTTPRPTFTLPVPTPSLPAPVPTTLPIPTDAPTPAPILTLPPLPTLLPVPFPEPTCWHSTHAHDPGKSCAPAKGRVK